MASRFLLIALLLLTGSAATCDKSKQFAVSVDRVAGYLDTAGALVASQVETGTISREIGARIVSDLRQVNRLNGDLISTARGYLTPDGSLRLTGDGQARLLAIVSSARQVITSRLSDPDFTNLSDGQRAEIARNLRQVETILVLLDETIRTAKILKGGGN